MRTQTSTNTKRRAMTVPPLNCHTLGDTEWNETATAHKETHDDINRHIYSASASLPNEKQQTENKHGSSKHATTPATRTPREQKHAPNLAFRLLTNRSNCSKNPPLHSLTASVKQTRKRCRALELLLHLRPTRVIKARITSKKFANLAHKTAFNRLPLAHQSHQLQQDPAISLPHFC
jgi:hypothetical protein